MSQCQSEFDPLPPDDHVIVNDSLLISKPPVVGIWQKTIDTLSRLPCIRDHTDSYWT